MLVQIIIIVYYLMINKDIILVGFKNILARGALLEHSWSFIYDLSILIFFIQNVQLKFIQFNAILYNLIYFIKYVLASLGSYVLFLYSVFMWFFF